MLWGPCSCGSPARNECPFSSACPVLLTFETHLNHYLLPFPQSELLHSLNSQCRLLRPPLGHFFYCSWIMGCCLSGSSVKPWVLWGRGPCLYVPASHLGSPLFGFTPAQCRHFMVCVTANGGERIRRHKGSEEQQNGRSQGMSDLSRKGQSGLLWGGSLKSWCFKESKDVFPVLKIAVLCFLIITVSSPIFKESQKMEGKKLFSSGSTPNHNLLFMWRIIAFHSLCIWMIFPYVVVQ